MFSNLSNGSAYSAICFELICSRSLAEALYENDAILKVVWFVFDLF